MSKAERGTKRICGGCGAKFYDLNRDPIVCPLCEAVMEIAPAAKPKPVVAEKVEEKAKPEETEAAAAASAKGPEIVSLDEVKADEQDGDDALVDDDEVIDLGDDDEDIPDSDDDDDTFLEDDDEEGSDVTDIIPSKVGSDSEET